MREFITPSPVFEDEDQIASKYTLLNQIEKLSNSITLNQAEDNQGNGYELLLIDSSSSLESATKRILDNEIRILIDSANTGIQKVIDCGLDTEQNKFYIVYESLADTVPIEQSRYRLEQSINILDELKKSNREGFAINSETIFQHNGQVKVRYIGLYELFKKHGVIEASSKKRKVRDDIYSLSKVFDKYLTDTEEKLKIHKKCIEGKYQKYRDLLDDLSLLEVDLNPEWKTMRIVTQPHRQQDFQAILTEMNSQCFWLIENKLSDKGEVTGQYTTSSYSGRFFVNKKDAVDTETSESVEGEYGYLFIPYPKYLQPKEHIKEAGELAKFNFKFDDENRIYDISYLRESFNEINILATLNKSKQDTVKKWKALPEKEKEFIEEKAFKARYFKREKSKSNNQNIVFTLDNNFKDWESIKNKKNEGVVLSIDENDIGKILDYKSGKNNNLLTIKDCKITLDEIRSQGELVEEVREQTSQYKKQIEACQKLESKDMVNPDLAGFIATPEDMPAQKYVSIDYELLSERIINQQLKSDETQTQAVLDAQYKKPVYLIQGPPGTGKTTVIVELVQQLINAKSDIKILIVSQSNLAVDNVLERLPDEVLFMRLASSQATKSNNVTEEIKPHIFDEKIKNWVDDTKQRSTNFLNEKFPKESKNNMLGKLYEQYARLPKSDADLLSTFRAMYNKGLTASYYQKLFDHVSSPDEIDVIFKKELGEKFLGLKKLQTDWFSFIQNATSKDGKKKRSMLNNGSQEIDLQIAFAMSVNVIGATCIHIASAQYNKINFKFDYMIMDESSKATASEALVPITMAKNIVLIGDHKQLPPVITREDAVKKKIKEALDDNGLDIDKEYGESIFETLINQFEKSNQLSLFKTMLDIQYRMPRQIGYLISKNIYNGELKNPEIDDYDESKNHYLELRKPLITIKKQSYPNSIIFVTTSKKENPYDNDDKFKRQNEANLKTIEETLLKLDEKYSEVSKKLTIGVIAGYRGQVELLTEKLDLKKYKTFMSGSKSRIEINTVDKFQGAERDIIIYDIVRSSLGESNIGFLDDYRRINVAFSRAKRLLVVVGDSEYILKRALLNPSSKFTELKIKTMMEQLKEWDCIYDSLEDALL